MHAGHGEVAGLHLLREPVHLAASVAVDDGLRDGESGVQVAQGLQLPLLALDGDEELLDTLQRQLVLLDYRHRKIKSFTARDTSEKDTRRTSSVHCAHRPYRKHMQSLAQSLTEDADGVTHELGGHLEHLHRERKVKVDVRDQ